MAQGNGRKCIVTKQPYSIFFYKCITYETKCPLKARKTHPKIILVAQGNGRKCIVTKQPYSIFFYKCITYETKCPLKARKTHPKIILKASTTHLEYLRIASRTRFERILNAFQTHRKCIMNTSWTQLTFIPIAFLTRLSERIITTHIKFTINRPRTHNWRIRNALMHHPANASSQVQSPKTHNLNWIFCNTSSWTHHTDNIISHKWSGTHNPKQSTPTLDLRCIIPKKSFRTQYLRRIIPDASSWTHYPECIISNALSRPHYIKPIISNTYA